MDLSNDAASRAADAVTGLLDGGTLRILTASGLELVRARFATPAYAPAVVGVASLEPMDAVRAVGTGTPARFEALTRAGRSVLTGTAGPEGSRAELIISAASVVIGAEILVTALPYRQPLR